MKQQINLYPCEEKPNIVPSAVHIFWASIGFLGFLIVITFFSIVGHFQEKNELKQVAKEEADLKQKLAVLEKKIPSPKVKEELEKQLKYLEEIRNSNEEILLIISKLQSDKFKGFSCYLKGLASQTVPGLWLTHFNFQTQGAFMNLEGKVLRPELVSKLMENLGEETVYRGKTFQIFKIALDPKSSQLQFILSPGETAK